MKRTPFLVAAALGLALCAAPVARGQSFLGKPMTTWVKELSSPDAKVRRSAAFALGKIGAPASSETSTLLRALKDDNAGVRDRAAAALGDIVADFKGGEAALWGDVGLALRKVLEEDRDARVRRSAAYGLGTFGKHAAPAAAALTKALADDNAGVRQNAAWALGRLGPAAGDAAVPALCKLLEDKEALVRRDAAGALGNLGSAAVKSGVTPLFALVKFESDDVVKKTALESLTHLAGAEHRGSAETLYPLLEDKDPEIARAAAFILGNMGGEPAARAIPVLRKTLKDPDPIMKGNAAIALAGMGVYAEPATADLARVVATGKDQNARRNAAIALGHIGMGARAAPAEQRDKVRATLASDAVPILARALSPSEPSVVRLHAAEALAHIAYPANKDAIPAILDVIKDAKNNRQVRQRCIWAFFNNRELTRYGADKVLGDVLRETGEGSEKLVRYDAARVLAYALGAGAPDKTVDVLLDMLGNKRLLIYNSTEGKVSGAGSESSAGSSAVTENKGGDARYMAAQALGWLGAKASGRDEAVKALQAAAKDPDKRLSTEAAKALDRLGVK